MRRCLNKKPIEKYPRPTISPPSDRDDDNCIGAIYQGKRFVWFVRISNIEDEEKYNRNIGPFFRLSGQDKECRAIGEDSSCGFWPIDVARGPDLLSKRRLS
jgi:hypothetical protein